MNEGERFWESIYEKASPASNGEPSAALVRFAKELSPGRALDLGCARGDDAVWLARRGWSVVGVDISERVLSYARANVESAQQERAITLERHDLSTSFPEGSFDLITAMFLQSPVTFPRHAVLSRAALAVNPGGLFLSVSHGSAAPWSWGDPDRDFPSPEEELASLELDLGGWERVFVGNTERIASGPGGQTAPVLDTIIALRRSAQG